MDDLWRGTIEAALSGKGPLGEVSIPGAGRYRRAIQAVDAATDFDATLRDKYIGAFGDACYISGADTWSDE